MSKPAARVGDMTTHGGTITVGLPTVLIGGMPAARMGDLHVCPMATPAVPPIPHVGGPVVLGSAGVLIGGVPAARMGDMCTCVGPPDAIAMGCPTVLIGEVGAGASSGGGGGGAGGAAGARAGAAAATIDTGVTTTTDPNWIAFEFVDRAGLPVAGVPYVFADPDGTTREGRLRVDGMIRQDGVSEGQGEVTLKRVYEASWSKAEARTGDEVTLRAKTEGFAAGTAAQIQICRRDLTGADSVVAHIDTSVASDAVEARWAYEYEAPEDESEEASSDWVGPLPYSDPTYFFDVIVGPCTARSGMLTYQDWVSIELRDAADRPMPNEEYVLMLPNGKVRHGTLDQNGTYKEENIPPARSRVRFPRFDSYQ